MNAQPLQEEEFERKTLWVRLKEFVQGPEEEDEDEYAVVHDTPSANRRRSSGHIQLHSARRGKVSVRLNAQVFEDVKIAADGLKSGEQQIVNLERASPQMAERIIDFLNGACYALDGHVERIGEKVYLFVPATIDIEVDGGRREDSVGSRTPYSNAR